MSKIGTLDPSRAIVCRCDHELETDALLISCADLRQDD